MTHAGTDHMAVPTPGGAEAYPQDVAGRISPLRCMLASRMRWFLVIGRHPQKGGFHAASHFLQRSSHRSHHS